MVKVDGLITREHINVSLFPRLVIMINVLMLISHYSERWMPPLSVRVLVQ